MLFVKPPSKVTDARKVVDRDRSIKIVGCSLEGGDDGCAAGVVDAHTCPGNGGEEYSRAGVFLEKERDVENPPGKLDADGGND